MKRKALVLSLISLILTMASLLVVAITYGWLAPLVTFPTNEMVVGDLRYSKAGAFITTPAVIIPGEELIIPASPLSITNNSPIASQMRIKVEYSKWSDNGGTPLESTEIYKAAASDALHVTFGSGFVCVGDYWYLYDGENEVIFEPAPNDPLVLISSIYYDGNNTTPDFAGQNCAITVTIQVKQADHVAWSTLTTYNFETGYEQN